MEENLCCPTCKNLLVIEDDMNNTNNITKLLCTSCNQAYNEEDDIYNLIPKNLTDFKAREATFHSDIVESYHDTAQLDALRNKQAHDDFLQPLKELPQGAKILELGCGLGQDGRILMQQGKHVIQSDISPKTLEIAKKKADEQKLQNNLFVLMDSENIPFPNNYLDATFMVASLHHMMDPEKALKEMARCTKKRGLIVIGVEPNKWQYYVLFPFIRFKKKYITKTTSYSPGDETTFGFNKNSFKDMAKKLNLEVVRISPVWYINGIIHVGTEALFRLLHLKERITLPQWIAKLICSLDNAIGYIPIIKNFSWHWNVVMKKRIAETEKKRKEVNEKEK
jgi:ubiquinone/menaquinone biosynthesis C-methylase UbiE